VKENFFCFYKYLSVYEEEPKGNELIKEKENGNSQSAWRAPGQRLWRDEGAVIVARGLPGVYTVLMRVERTAYRHAVWKGFGDEEVRCCRNDLDVKGKWVGDALLSQRLGCEGLDRGDVDYNIYGGEGGKVGVWSGAPSNVADDDIQGGRTVSTVREWRVEQL
jgi:hypothetical protein